MYWNDGDREIGDYKDGKEIGIFARLCKKWRSKNN